MKEVRARAVWDLLWIMGSVVLFIVLVGLVIASGFAFLSSSVLLGVLFFASFLIAGWVWRSIIPENAA